MESWGLEPYLMMFMLPPANSKHHLVSKQTHLRRIKQVTEKAFRQVKDEDTADVNNGIWFQKPRFFLKKTRKPFIQPGSLSNQLFRHLKSPGLCIPHTSAPISQDKILFKREYFNKKPTSPRPASTWRSSFSIFTKLVVPSEAPSIPVQPPHPFLDFRGTQAKAANLVSTGGAPPSKVNMIRRRGLLTCMRLLR